MAQDIHVAKQRRRRSGGGGVRIEQVATVAGVSTSTVSRVLNTPDSVSERTRSQVWAAMEATGYVPNRLAGSLATSRPRSIGLIIPHIMSSVFSELVRGLADKLAAANYELMLGLSGYSSERELEHIRAFLGQRVAGLVMVGFSRAPEARRLLQEVGIPVVETSDLGREAIDMTVGYSNRDAARTMVEFLFSCGYQRIALISQSTVDNDRELSRREGYLSAMEALKAQPLIVETSNGLVGGAEGLRKVLSIAPDVEAIFCTNDMLAAGCVLEAERRHIRVPDDIGVAGFGDIDLAQEFVPALTTVRVRRYDVGAQAGALLLEHIGGRMPEAIVLDLGFDLVPRGSTRRLRKSQ